MVRRGLILSLCVSALLIPKWSFAGTITLDAVARGWYEDGLVDGPNGSFPWNNYLVGGVGTEEYRDWFTFELSGVSGTIVSATLLLDNPGFPDNGFFSSGSPSETYTVFDVDSGNIAGLGTSLNFNATFADLGTGTSYGSFVATSAANGTTVSILLNDAALAAVNAALGSPFAVGGAITTLNPSVDAERLFGFSGGRTRLQLVTEDLRVVPEPATLLLLGTGLAGVAGKIRRRRS